MRSVLRVLLIATTSVTLFTGVAATLGPTPVHASDGAQAPPAATKTTAEPPAKDVASQGMTITAWVSLFGALLSGVFAALAYKLSRTTAFRTATIESQRMLLDINKAYLADPKLLAIEGEYDASTVTDPEFPAKLKAMAYMKLNVFEVVYASFPTSLSSLVFCQAKFSWPL